MKNNRIFILLIIAGAFLFNTIFWHEQLALNAILFDVFIVSSIFFLYESAWKSSTVKYLLIAHIVCLGTLIVLNSMVSKIAFSATLLLLIAFAEYSHRSAWFAGGSLLISFWGFIGRFFRLLNNRGVKKPAKKNFVRYIRFAFFPLVIAVCFFIIYSLANTVFANIANNIGNVLQKMASNFFSLFSFDRIMFLLFGFYLTGALLLRAKQTRFEKNEGQAVDDLKRTRKKRMDIKTNLFYDITVGVMGKLAKGAMALKNEYKTGLISLGLLNLLLLVINIIDINYLWIHFTYTPNIDLYTMIHEGTDLLILSIVLAMLVLLIFFRGNLNFYKNNKRLKAGACLWLFQNAILVCSVLLRDYYYIREFGLAYKRIGVLFFLLLVLAGLITFFIKIQFAKTNYYLLRINAWCVVVLLILGSTIQWDVFIAKYNIEHRQTAPLNLPYLLTLSDKTLPLLYQNIDVLKLREKELNERNIQMNDNQQSLETILAERLSQYKTSQADYSWLSWNLADEQTRKYFSEKQVALK